MSRPENSGSDVSRPANTPETTAGHAPVDSEPAEGNGRRRKRKDKTGPVAAAEEAFVMPVNPRLPGPAKRRAMLFSALIVIGLPTLVAGIYYAFFASDQYAATGHFIVRHRNDSAAMTGALSVLGLGTPPSGSTPDTMVVNDYMVSLQMIKDLGPLVDLRALYDKPQIDAWARLRPPWGRDFVSDENLRNYWQKMATVHFDQTTGLSRFEVRAFSAEDAKTIADHVFRLSEDLVNRLSERSQEDALALARREVESYRVRALESLDALLAFQERAQQVDPQGFAAARNEIQAGIEQELTQLQAQLDVLRKRLPEDAPGISQVKDRLNVVEKQLATERARSTVSVSGESAAKILNDFEKLKLESEFATQAYMSSLASLESARVEAIRQNLYLETFVRPHLPQIPEYPRALLNTVLVFVVSFLVWAIGGLLLSAAREHA
jgi:capsular polysaccharide transport system permease protein